MGEVSLIDVSKRFTLRVGNEAQTVHALARETLRCMMAKSSP